MPNILQDLNPAQQEAVQATDGPILIVAGPGSGKTRCLTYKAAHLIQKNLASPNEILLCTFTNKSANEMKERVRKLLASPPAEEKGQALGALGPNSPGPGPKREGPGPFPSDPRAQPWIGTFHATCARILRIDGKEIGLPPNFVIYDDGDSKRLIKKILKKLRISEKDLWPGAVLGTIEGAKHELVDAASYPNYAHGYFQEQVAQIYPKYQKTLAENQALDFGDLIFKTVRLLELRPEVLEKWQNRFHYILVDEYQDTNRAQYVFVKMLAQKHRNLCVVGDISQAIYSWRGADFRNILNFEKDWPGAQIFRLEQNYRSTKKIIRAAKEVIEHNRTHIALSLRTENPPGERIRLYEAEDEKDEAEYVVRRIRNLHRHPESRLVGTKDPLPGRDSSPRGLGAQNDNSSDFAVLYRTNAQSRVFEETFIREGIPYQLVGGVKFYERREIKDILSYLRIIENPHDHLSLERIINVPPRKIGKKSQEKLEVGGWKLEDVDKIFEFSLEKLLNQKEVLPPLGIMDTVLSQTGYLRWLDNGSDENLSRIENVKELRSVASKFETLKEFLENVALVQNGYLPKGPAKEKSPNSPESDSSLCEESDSFLGYGKSPNCLTVKLPNCPTVTLMTLHAAKGLEFPVVFIVGLEEGLFPHSRSMMDNLELEEERRLCYVGITRAQKELHLTYTRKRLYFGGNYRNEPSRFLAEIPEELIERLVN